MRRTEQNVRELVIPIAGAGNPSVRSVSTAHPHLCLLRQALRSGPERLVTEPLVPAKLGIGDLDSIYRSIADEMDELVEAWPEAKVIIVGHSLGGLLGRRWSTERQLDGLVTLGSPHNGVRTRLPLPAQIRESYQAFADATPVTINVPIATIGSKYDELVPLRSSLANLPGANSYRIDKQGLLPIIHNFLPLAPYVTTLARRLVDEMLDSSARVPAPEIAPPALARPA